jgi:hypothetical protein
MPGYAPTAIESIGKLMASNIRAFGWCADCHHPTTSIFATGAEVRRRLGFIQRR